MADKVLSRRMTFGTLLLAMLLLAFTSSYRIVSANTAYGPNNEPGKTYQNNWDSDCRWFSTPGHPDHSGCYRGVWSDTDTPSAQTAKVSEWAWSYQWVCVGGCMNVWVEMLPVPKTQQATSYATVNHCCGSWNGISEWPVNVYGQGQHWNVTVSGQVSWWTLGGPWW